ncbi:hypothetical protein ES319_A12G117200v1 [Gossypium barbadense]|uniref:Cytochrome b5 heme-binding domain-containing protein n=2 Tax=Gossypium TaxID=3633 RepID=A0A5J5T9B5_GOSBA|nr:hypothetical protein ES319_A12G117200v1 [Gossypium barbadense]TYG89767.1 hypothetical protein ES288_A12G127000v1 [Gossypium darwinii]
MECDKKYITIQQLEQHNKAGDLWVSINGKVYNVSDWSKYHPGGETPLLNLAGKDVTDAFTAYHPTTAWQYLNKFFTGYRLKDYEVSEVSKDYRNIIHEFTKAGMFENKGHTAVFTLTSVAAMFGFVFYGVLCCNSLWVHLCSAMVLGMAWIQSAYIGHDSGHYIVMSGHGWNKFVQLITGNCLTGISIAWWKWTHNAHHIACNSLDYDPDLQHIPVFAVSSRLFNSVTSSFYGRKLEFDYMARILISYQHWTFYPIMCVARVNLYIQTLLLLFSKRQVQDRTLNIMGIIVFWTWFPLLVSWLPNWSHRVMFVLTSFVVISIQHVQFCLNHFSANVYVGPPNGNDWFEKQTNGTLDISCSPWMDWFFGGLQFQLEHHLFPRLPRCHLRQVAPLVRDLCNKHNLPYNSLSFWEANELTIRTLKMAAMEARDVNNSGVSKNLLWEAVTIHG